MDTGSQMDSRQKTDARGVVETCWYPEGVGGAQVELLPDLLWRSGTQTVEDVIVPLIRTLCADPRLLQQVMGHEAAHDGVLPGGGKQG